MTNLSIKKLVNDEKVFTTFINLYLRWQDEYLYEDFNAYADFMKKTIEPVVGSVTEVKGMKRPFGIAFNIKNERFKLFLKIKGDYCSLCAQRVA